MKINFSATVLETELTISMKFAEMTYGKKLSDVFFSLMGTKRFASIIYVQHMLCMHTDKRIVQDQKKIKMNIMMPGDPQIPTLQINDKRKRFIAPKL